MNASFLVFGVIAAALSFLAYAWLFTKIREHYRRLSDASYVKGLLSGKRWMGRPITARLIRRMTFLTGVPGVLLFLSSLYVLFSLGATLAWAALTAFGLILMYGARMWAMYPQLQRKVKVTDANVRFTRVYTKVFSGIIIAILILLPFFKNALVQPPYPQVLIIGVALLIIIGSEIHYRMVSS